jgi:diguanylate cyclase
MNTTPHKPTAPPSPAAPQPVDIAREAFRRLATRRIAPTPDAYRAVYEEIAGVTAAPAAGGAEQVLAHFAVRVAEMPGELSELGKRLQRQHKLRDWDAYARLLAHLIEKHVRKGSTIELLGVEPNDTRLLRDMLSRTLMFALAALLSGAPELASEAEALGDAVKRAHSEDALQEIAARLKELCYQVELDHGDMAERQELLLRLFRLLLDNVSDLLEDDSSMRGQVAAVQELIAGPLSHRALEDATRNLKEVIYHQGVLRSGLSDLRQKLKQMMTTFVERLGNLASSTGDFHDKLGAYMQRIGGVGDVAELNTVLDEVLRETRQVQQETAQSRAHMLQAHRDVAEAEQRIRELQAQLEEMSELARPQHDTASLDGQALEDAFARLAADLERRGKPLCLALLDLVDFKRLDQIEGQDAGSAMEQLGRVARQVLRPVDLVTRADGEQFLILLPDTALDAAAATMTRLQRELTRHFFLLDNGKLLITFAAGVALRQSGEDHATLAARAGHAMQLAKQSGKNRVVIAE